MLDVVSRALLCTGGSSDNHRFARCQPRRTDWLSVPAPASHINLPSTRRVATRRVVRLRFRTLRESGKTRERYSAAALTTSYKGSATSVGLNRTASGPLARKLTCSGTPIRGPCPHETSTKSR